MKNKIIMFIGFCLVALTTILYGCDPYKRKSSVIPNKDTNEQIVLPTVTEVLQYRETLRYDAFVDSVFLDMPEQILVHILNTKGTNLSNAEIVDLYIRNKYFYDTLKKAMDIQKVYLPDSIPKSSIPQTNSDSIPVAIQR